MKTHAFRIPHSAFRTRQAFTLVELLVVISIIAILAALLLPVLGSVKIKAQKKKAEVDAGGIVTAISSYEADYSKFPVSSVGAVTASSEAARLGEDFTYGTRGVICVGPRGSNPYDDGVSSPTTVGFSTPGAYQAIRAPGNYQTNNSEVMSVLLDMESWPNSPTQPTINKDHVKNPTRNHYLNATMSGDNKSAGIGNDGVYRDPWGNPYIITIDLNYDDKARDAFYRDPNVSADPTDTVNNPKRGLNGLVPTVVSGKTFYEANSPVMVWSPGPDKLIDPNTANDPGHVATRGANKDNIVSWR